jgi:hypothetical protein
VTYSLAGLAVIAAMAWAMNALWKRGRRRRLEGGAAAFLFKIMGGYEPTPVTSGGLGAFELESEEDFESSITDDHTAGWTFVHAPETNLDVMRIRFDTHSVPLSPRGEALMRTALVAPQRAVDRAHKALLTLGRSDTVTRHGPAVGAGASPASFAAALHGSESAFLVRGAYEVALNARGRAFADSLVAAPLKAIEDAEIRFGLRSDEGHWMPGDEFGRRGGVLKPYE